MKASDAVDALHAALAGFAGRSTQEIADLERMRALIDRGDPWNRATALHVTASALVIDPGSARVLLRWHPRLRSWAHVGGHGDEGEIDPYEVARREAIEETGLTDLEGWPDRGKTPIQVAIVPVPALRDQPAHEHADIRFVFATESPQLAVAESDSTPVKWLPFADAMDEVSEEQLKELLRRASNLLR
jgi:8-oxo-dGTP pyrophosphatase MutT (NUDIX family)